MTESKQFGVVMVVQRGNAALEVMMLLPVILLIFVLIVNMGYNGLRHRKSQTGLRLGAFYYVDGLAESDRDKARAQAESLVSQKFFAGESSPVRLRVSGQKNTPANLPGNEPLPTKDEGLLGSVSFRQEVWISVDRTPPYDIFPSTPIDRHLVLAANTFTYCEMKDDDYGGSMDVFSGLAWIGSSGLWLFGGCGGNVDSFSCKDRCK